MINNYESVDQYIYIYICDEQQTYINKRTDCNILALFN